MSFDLSTDLHCSEMEDHFVKGSMEDFGAYDSTDGTRRGLFRRARRGDAGVGHTPSPSSAGDAVATVDDLARRMDDLATSVADNPVRAEFELQRAVIARANDLAAANGSATVGVQPVGAPAPLPTAHTTHNAPEASVPQTAPTTDTAPVDFEARMDAALTPVAPTAPAQPTPVPAQLVATPTTAPPVASSYVPSTTERDAVAVLGIDIARVVRTIQEEASSVQQRIEFEVRDAHVQATDIIDRAESEAERIREHGQSQARVLLGEVEEIISEAQQTGEQILHRANDEASGMRKDASSVLKQAQTEARAIVETARGEGEHVLAEQRRLATVRAQEAMREQDRLKDQIRRLEERRRQVLESLEPLISQLTQMMPAGIEQNVVQLERQHALSNQG